MRDSIYPGGSQFTISPDGDYRLVEPARDPMRQMKAPVVFEERPAPPPLRDALVAWAAWFAEQELTLTSVTRAMVEAAAQLLLSDDDLAAIIRPWAVAVERGPDQLNKPELDLWRSYGNLTYAQEAVTDGMIACDEASSAPAPAP